MMKKNNVITYEIVKERLKNKPLSEWTNQDVFDRYVAYGNDEELNTPDIQELLIKHGYIDELINLVDNVIYDAIIINDILNSKIIKEKDYIVRKGCIVDILFCENDELPDEFLDVVIKLKDDNSNIIDIKDLCYLINKEKYKNDLEKYRKNIIIITENRNGTENKICAVKG